MTPLSKEERKRRREEERGEEMKQAVEDIEWLRERGVSCSWYEAREVNNRTIREHSSFAFEDTRTNRGANAYVDERHLRIERGDRMARLSELESTEGGRDVLREAFKIADMKGAAYDL